MLEPLPHVGSVIYASDHERVVRLLTMLRETIEERALRF
jgi:S-DNA-T family DNA segregation ATPase FtsK/SpoIIIE